QDVDRRLRSERTGTGASVPAVEQVETDVCGDAVQPGSQLGSAFEPVVATPGAHHRLLHRVLGLERRAEHAVAVRGELPSVLLEGRVDPGIGDLGHPAWVP